MTMTREEIRLSDIVDLYSISCFEYFTIEIAGDKIHITRLPGGWMFEYFFFDDYNHPNTIERIFVPYSDEFKPTL
jgi:hypothetical protein